MADMTVLLSSFKSTSRLKLPVTLACCTLTSRTCSSRARPPPIHVVEKGLRETLDLLTLPARHVLRSMNLQTLNLVFDSQPWNQHEFPRGTAEAFRCVLEHVGDQDFNSLSGLVSDPLLEELRHDEIDAGESKRRVIDVCPFGILTAQLELDENVHLAIWVTQLMSAVEEYDSPNCRDTFWRVERLHRWTFKRVLLSGMGEENGPWQVVSMNHRRWRPPVETQ